MCFFHCNGVENGSTISHYFTPMKISEAIGEMSETVFQAGPMEPKL